MSKRWLTKLLALAVVFLTIESAVATFDSQRNFSERVFSSINSFGSLSNDPYGNGSVIGAYANAFSAVNQVINYPWGDQVVGGVLPVVPSIGALGAVEETSILGKITGYTKHGLNQAISREGMGGSPQAILNAVGNPSKVVQQAEGAVKYIGNNATVILNKEGKIITTYPLNSQGIRN